MRDYAIPASDLVQARVDAGDGALVNREITYEIASKDVIAKMEEALDEKSPLRYFNAAAYRAGIKGTRFVGDRASNNAKGTLFLQGTQAAVDKFCRYLDSTDIENTVKPCGDISGTEILY